jgi:hypothetical protein
MPQSDFQEAAREQRASFLGEFLFFLKENKKWWLVPFLIVLAMLAMLAMVSSTSLAPFIYTLF